MAMLLAAAVGLVAVPGLALFYGGMARVGRAARILALSAGAAAVIGAVWVSFGYGLVFGAPLVPGVVGDPAWRGAVIDDPGVLVAGSFCVVSVILASTIVAAAVASRMRLRAWLVFVPAWVSTVCLPVLYWILNEDDGWAAGLGVADLAGGAFVQVGAAAAALALLLALGPVPPVAARPRASRGVLLTGAALVWVGCLGLNVAAEGALDQVTGLILMNTLAAPVAGILGWMLADKLSTGRVTTAGPASGAVSGLVAIAPGCGSFDPGWAAALGLVAGAICSLVALSGRRRGYTDSFRIVAIHLAGGVTGMLYIGVFAAEVGFIYNGNPAQSVAQAATVLIVGLYSFALSWVIGIALRKWARLSASGRSTAPVATDISV